MQEFINEAIDNENKSVEEITEKERENGVEMDSNNDSEIRGTGAEKESVELTCIETVFDSKVLSNTLEA